MQHQNPTREMFWLISLVVTLSLTSVQAAPIPYHPRLGSPHSSTGIPSVDIPPTTEGYAPHIPNVDNQEPTSNAPPYSSSVSLVEDWFSHRTPTQSGGSSPWEVVGRHEWFNGEGTGEERLGREGNEHAIVLDNGRLDNARPQKDLTEGIVGRVEQSTEWWKPSMAWFGGSARTSRQKSQSGMQPDITGLDEQASRTVSQSKPGQNSDGHSQLGGGGLGGDEVQLTDPMPSPPGPASENSQLGDRTFSLAPQLPPLSTFRSDPGPIIPQGNALSPTNPLALWEWWSDGEGDRARATHLGSEEANSPGGMKYWSGLTPGDPLSVWQAWWNEQKKEDAPLPPLPPLSPISPLLAQPQSQKQPLPKPSIQQHQESQPLLLLPAPSSISQVAPPLTPPLQLPPVVDPSTQRTYPPSPKLAELDPYFCQSRINPLSAVDPNDPIPCLTKWWEIREKTMDWERTNNRPYHSSGFLIDTPPLPIHGDLEVDNAIKVDSSTDALQLDEVWTPSVPRGGSHGSQTTPEGEREASWRGKPRVRRPSHSDEGGQRAPGTPQFPHPESPGMRVFGGVGGETTKGQREEIMQRLGAPAKNKWGFLKWMFDNSESGKNLKNWAMEWGGAMLGHLLSTFGRSSRES